MNRKIAYLIGFLIGAGYLGVTIFAPEWVKALIASAMVLGAFTWGIGSLLSSPRRLPKIRKGDDT